MEFSGKTVGGESCDYLALRLEDLGVRISVVLAGNICKCTNVSAYYMLYKL